MEIGELIIDLYIMGAFCESSVMGYKSSNGNFKIQRFSLCIGLLRCL